uniref:Uncharacterized protein n=1 Tax=Lepeophtheirus salmonis TaxID=72036 RepID=A0A0K2TZV7_LEPSM
MVKILPWLTLAELKCYRNCCFARGGRLHLDGKGNLGCFLPNGKSVV